MAIFRQRLPTRPDLQRVFAVCVFPAFSWSILWYLQNVFAWLPYLDVWNTLSIFAYTQAFALLESTLLTLLLVGLAMLAPGRLLREEFTVQASTAALGLTFWTILFQLVFDPVIRGWTVVQFILWFGLALATVLVAGVLAHRSRRIQRLVVAAADRLTVFLYLYVPLGVLGALVVLGRNIV